MQKGIAKVTSLGQVDYESPNFQRDDGIRVEERLQLPHLQQLLHWFESHRPASGTPSEPVKELLSTPKKPQREAGLLTKEEFCETLVKVLGTHDYDDQLDNLFTRLDTSCDGYVDWNEFCTYMLLQFRENDYMKAKKLTPFQTEAKIKHNVHNRQETTTKIVAAENPTKYVSVSKEGAICVWDSNLHFERHYSLTEREETSQTQRRRVKEWVTDMVFMPNCHKLAISSSGRDIRFFDATSTQYFEEFYLYGLANVATCLHYWCDRENPGHESVLLYGDDHGEINILYFHRPLMQLFASPFKKEEGVQKIFYRDLGLHSRWVKTHNLEGIHYEPIRKLVYMAENDCVISSSGSSKNSLVIMDIQRKKKTYIFKLNKGVDCFDYNKNINLLVTGSTDHLVRFWNPYVTSKPTAILEGHQMSIVDLKIHEQLNQVFSLSRDTVLKVWDVKEHACLQTILIKFPSSLLGRLPDFGPHVLHLQPAPQNALLVCANDYIALLRVGQSGVGPQLVPTTHLTQLCCAIYNPLFKQVVTAADDSTMAVWELETGAKNMMFTNSHGKEEITCLTFDLSWRRLISGARNGTIKIWNFQTGHHLHSLEAVSEAEVTGVTPIPDKQLALSVGWSRQIVKYHTSDQDTMNIKADTSWKTGQAHEEDILASAYSHSLGFYVTASFDGEMCVWSLEKESLYCHLRKKQKIKVETSSSFTHLPIRCSSSSTSSLSNSRPNSRHRKSHRPTPGQPAPVDKVIFLHSRARMKNPEMAILVSSEAGLLKFWSVFGQKKELGHFYAPQAAADESVLALTSNEDDSILVSGDTHGSVSLWDISDYCLTTEKHRVTDPPPLIRTWAAHEAALVSVDLVKHPDCGDFVITASTDKTAKLWDLSGSCVGCFGQKELWSLKNKSSWVDAPPTEENSEIDVLVINTNENGNDDEKVEPPENTGLKDEGNKEEEEETEKASTADDTDIPQSLPMPKQAKSHSMAIDENLKRPRKFSLDRCHTVHIGQITQPTFKSFLGQSVDKHLARRINDRQNRRNNYGEVEFRQTNLAGKLCCPYQVLATKDIDDIQLPSNLPLAPKMHHHGMTSSNLTLDYIRHLNLKDPSDNNHPGVDVTKPLRTRESRRDDRTKLPSIRPSIRKSQTFVGSTAQDPLAESLGPKHRQHPLSAIPYNSSS